MGSERQGRMDGVRCVYYTLVWDKFNAVCTTLFGSHLNDVGNVSCRGTFGEVISGIKGVLEAIMHFSESNDEARQNRKPPAGSP